MRKREFLAGLGLGMGLAAGAGLCAQADDYIHGKNLGAAPPEKKKEVPHRKVTTRNLFKVPHGYPNGVAVAAEGVWVANRRRKAMARMAATLPKTLGCLTGTASCSRRSHTQSSNTSGLAYGDGHVWMGANGGPEGIYEVDMNSKTVSHRQIPLGPADNGGGCHGLMWHDGKLWIVANRLRGILRVDPTTWMPEFIIPITTCTLARHRLGRHHPAARSGW